MKIVEYKEASPQIKAIYNAIKDELGIVPNFLKVLALRPELLDWWWRGWKIIVGSNTGNNSNSSASLKSLSKEVKMMIAFEAAKANECPVCINNTKELMKSVGIDDAAMQKLQDDIGSSNLEEKTKSILTFCYAAATSTSSKIDPNLLSAFKRILSDEVLIEAVETLAFFRSTIDFEHMLDLPHDISSKSISISGSLR